MMRTSVIAACALVLGAASVFASATSAARLSGSAQPLVGVTYKTVDYPGAAWTQVNGVNRSGPLGRTVEVVGSFGDVQGGHGFLLSGGHYTRLDVPLPNAEGTQAFAINSQHQVLGTFYDGWSGNTCPFVYAGGTYRMISLGNCYHNTNPDSFAARGLNNTGQLVGNLDSWDLGAKGGFLATLSGGIAQYAYTVNGYTALVNGLNNNAGPQMVGSYTGADQHSHGARFSGLNRQGNSFDVPGATDTTANAINDASLIVGSYRTGYPLHGFVDAKNTFGSIDYPGAQATAATGINNPDPLTGTYNIVGSYGPNPGMLNQGFIATVTPVQPPAQLTRPSARS